MTFSFPGSRLSAKVVLLCFGALSIDPARAEDDFNNYIERAIKSMEKYYHKGFDGNLSAYYSHDLDYADVKDKDGKPPIKARSADGALKTMCVASAAEVIIEALNLYWKDGGTPVDKESRKADLMKFPPERWSRIPEVDPLKGDIRPYLFTQSWCSCAGKLAAKKSRENCNLKDKKYQQYEVKLTDGTAEALEVFGIGKVIKRSRQSQDVESLDLKRGDFINFDRRHGDGDAGGHATVFWDWIVKDGKRIGYRYFSAQNERKTNGLGFMNAYFLDPKNANFHNPKSPDTCPVKKTNPDKKNNDCKCPRGIRLENTNDCGVDKNTLVIGRMWHPRSWKVDPERRSVIKLLTDKGLRCAWDQDPPRTAEERTADEERARLQKERALEDAASIRDTSVSDAQLVNDSNPDVPNRLIDGN